MPGRAALLDPSETSMTATWSPPRPTYHLRVFAVCLTLVAAALLVMLFGVQLEAVVPATGTITARDLIEVRTRLSGLAEPGWYEGQRFHRLEPGDILQPGQALATVRDEVLRLQLQRVEDRLKDMPERGDAYDALIRERDRLRDYQAQGILRAPASGACWLVTAVRVAPLQKVDAGDVLAVIVAADPVTHLPTDLVARLDVDERHWANVAPGQTVRLSSNSFNPRLFGHAQARIDRLEPLGEAQPSGERVFHALAAITQSPFVLPLGSSFQAEVLAGKKPVYRIILEH